MAKDQITTVSDAVHKLQLALLDGIEDETQLFAAGSLMSRSDYEDVVTERSISYVCGYPLCQNALPSERPQKGDYRISLKEHKVYDLNETFMYCCSSCLINSRAFSGSLNDERCLVLNPMKLNEILSLFKNLGLESEEDIGTSEDFGLSKLTIQENTEIKAGEASMEELIGPSNAIEGYVPRRDRNSKSPLSKAPKKASEAGNAKLSKHNDTIKNKADFEISVITNEDTTGSTKALKNDKDSRDELSMTPRPLLKEMDFMNTIITNDEYTISKKSEASVSSKPAKSTVKKGYTPKKPGSKKGKDSIFSSVDFNNTIITEDEYSVSKTPSSEAISNPSEISPEFIEKLSLCDTEGQLRLLKESSDQTQNNASSSNVHLKAECCVEQVQSSKTTAKSSLKTSGAKKAARSVTWADKKNNSQDGDLCEVREFKDSKEGPTTVIMKEAVENDDSERFAVAEACAMALSHAAEKVASGQSDVNDAVSKAGIILLPRPQEADEEEYAVEGDVMEEDTAPVKWPKKPDDLNSDFFDSEDSWFDAPPEGFSLTLSPFATMWNALFSWMTSFSLAYIYGRDESSHEEYLSVNGREYPSKVVLPDGRSLQIKQTLAGCLARALPGVIAELKLPTPVSTLEQGLACLLNTMSFMDALPPFRMKQWQVIVLLFIDALSICRIPGITPHLTSRRILIPKVLDGAQISVEEYEILKDLVIPLGRVPQFSMQSGG